MEATPTAPAGSLEEIAGKVHEAQRRAEQLILQLANEMGALARANAAQLSALRDELAHLPIDSDDRAVTALMSRIHTIRWSEEALRGAGIGLGANSTLAQLRLGVDETDFSNEIRDAIESRKRRKIEAELEAKRARKDQLLKQHPELADIIREEVAAAVPLSARRPRISFEGTYQSNPPEEDEDE